MMLRVIILAMIFASGLAMIDPFEPFEKHGHHHLHQALRHQRRIRSGAELNITKYPVNFHDLKLNIVKICYRQFNF